MRLPYQKDDIYGIDLYRLAQKNKDAFIVRSILYSHCFEYAITAIPKDIAYDKASDFTDNIDETFDILVKRGFATITDTEVIINGAPERVLNGLEYSNKISEKQKNYRERQKNKANQSKEQQSINDKQDTNNDDNTDYKSLVQQWNCISPMTDIQLKTSYARFKASNSWDLETVKNALEFIGNNPGIKNKIMCDWFEAGFFLPGYVFNVDTINNHFESKVKKVNGKKDDCGTGVVYDDQGHPPPQWNTRKLSGYAKTNEPSEQDIELKRQLEEVLE